MATNLRPLTFDEFKGKENIKEQLLVSVNCAKQLNKPLDHCLFYGLPGTGKTTLANIIANELNRKIRIVQGNSIQKNIDVINLALTLSENEILFIDEIHAVNRICIELFYSIMEDFVIDVSIGKDFNSKITRIQIPHFTLIGATTFLGKIPQALEERFGIIVNLGLYDTQTISEIIKQDADKLNLILSDEQIEKIASVSKGIPRIAIRVLKRVNDYYLTNDKITIEHILKNINIYDDGLDDKDIAYLRVFVQNDYNSLGLKTLSQITGIDQETIEVKIEPFLLSNGYMNKTISGRIITKKGIDFIKNI
jgi:Holliday junction DNA helicase RuvB